MGCEIVFEPLVSAGYTLSLCGFSALDRYMGLPPLPFTWVETNAALQVLARLFEGLRFPGVDLADGAVETGGEIWYFRCFDQEESPGSESCPSYTLLSLTQDLTTRRFRDPRGIYPLLRELRDGPREKVPGGPRSAVSPP
ncbi:MAG: phosphohydrolase, partial [Spirochaetaceae bacterium]|nr:phosphohydrolase [Spirochaetaceae bacterium]